MPAADQVLERQRTRFIIDWSSVLISAGTSAIVTEGFHGLLESLQANVGLEP